MLLSLDLLSLPPGAATVAFLRTRRALARAGDDEFRHVLYLARFTTLPGPVPSYVSFAVLGAWPERERLEQFRADAPWGRGVRQHAGLTLAPYRVRGAWESRRLEVDQPDLAPAGPVLAITRARTAKAYHPATWRANPAIVRSLRANPDVLWSRPFADRAVGVIGTFSLWPDDQALTRFAYGKGDAHAPVVGQSKRGQWLPESWFARAQVLDSFGRWPDGVPG